MFSRLTDFLNSVSCKVTALLLLSIGTILFFNLYEKYSVIGPELIRNARFDSNLVEWKHTPYGILSLAPAVDGVRLHSEVPTMLVQISQINPGADRYPLLRLSCDIKTHNVSPGQERWMTARVDLVSHNLKGGAMYHLPHIVASLRGTHTWEHHEAVFARDASTAWFSVSAQLAQATGTMWVKNLSLRPVAELASFYKIRNAVTLLWVTAAFWLTIPLARSALNNTHRTTVIALALAIAFGVLMPESLKEHIGSALFPSMAESLVKSPNSATFKFTPLMPASDIYIYKAGHYLIFAMLAVAAFHRKPYPSSRAQMLGYLLLFALVTEVLQLLVVGRSAQFGDVLIDSAGIATGWVFLRIAQIFYPPSS